MFTSELLLFLVFASCALFAIGRSIPRGPIKLDEPSYEAFKKHGEATSTWKNDVLDQTNLEHEEDMLAARGILDGVKNKVNQAKQKAEEYKDKAKEKAKEVKNKVEALPGTVMNKLPGGLGKREFNDLKNVRKNNIELLDESEDGIFNKQEVLDQTNLEPEEDMLVARGILDGVKNKVNQAKQKAEEYKGKAKEKVNEVKNKAQALPGTVINKLPGGLDKREFNDLKNVRKNNIELSVESEDGILNRQEDVNQESDMNDARERTNDARTMSNKHAYNADDTAHSKLVVDNDEQDYHEFDSLNDLYEDEEQDNHLEEVKEQNDESLGEEVFVMENEE